MARNVSKYTERELEILQILWDSEKALIASEIAVRGKKLTINTTQAVLKSLLKKNLIQVAEIVYSGKVLSRSYITSITQEKFELSRIEDSVRAMKSNVTIPMLVAAFVKGKDNEKSSLEELEQWLKEQKSF